MALAKSKFMDILGKTGVTAAVLIDKETKQIRGRALVISKGSYYYARIMIYFDGEYHMNGNGKAYGFNDALAEAWTDGVTNNPDYKDHTPETFKTLQPSEFIRLGLSAFDAINLDYHTIA